jgi:hypothetical protein
MPNYTYRPMTICNHRDALSNPAGAGPTVLLRRWLVIRRCMPQLPNLFWTQ